MKSILFFDCSPGISGAELSLSDLVDGLDSNKFTVFLATNNKELAQKADKAKVNVTLLKVAWVKKTWNPVSLLNYSFQYTYASLWLYRFAKKRGVDIICSNTVKSYIYTYLSSFFLKAKRVVFVRDNIYQYRLYQRILKRADHTIPVSEFINEQIKVNSLRRNVIYGGIDCSHWSCYNGNLPNNLRKGLGLSPETYIASQIGQLTPWKNHIDFLKAAQIITQKVISVHFVIIGDCISACDFPYKKALLEEVEKFGLTNKISFIGIRNDIRAVISQIDILMHPAIGEPFGRVLIEAMAMKKPIVAYNCGGPSEIVVNTETGYLVKPHDYKGLAEKTIDLLSDKSLQKQFGEAGRKKVEKEFDINRHISRMEEIFERI